MESSGWNAKERERLTLAVEAWKGIGVMVDSELERGCISLGTHRELEEGTSKI